jgi:subtilisin family serine protease
MVSFIALFALASVGRQAPQTGINIVLNTAPSNAVLNDLREHGIVLDVIPQIKAVTIKARESELKAIRGEKYVASANLDSIAELAGVPRRTFEDFSAGASQWSLDAINVTEVGAGRTVEYAGGGVYIAVIDTGLENNWRAYFPEDRIAAQFAVALGGGGGEQGSVTSAPQSWEHDTHGHGTWITSIILGFRYRLDQPSLPPIFNGVAPSSKVIPVKAFTNAMVNGAWNSVLTRGILYVAHLKTSGALGASPVVINASWGGGSDDPMMAAAIDYAIAHGVIVVAAAHNFAEGGMAFPGRYAPVISAAASGWVGQLPSHDSSQSYNWITDDIPESDPSAHFIAPFSSWELPGQDLDVAAPGSFVPIPVTSDGRADYSFFVGTSASTPHIAGVAALMLQKNPTLTQAQIESILESTAMPMPPASRDIHFGLIQHGNIGGRFPTLRNGFANSVIIDLTASWANNANGAGLLQADAALAATPTP